MMAKARDVRVCQHGLCKPSTFAVKSARVFTATRSIISVALDRLKHPADHIGPKRQMRVEARANAADQGPTPMCGLLQQQPAPIFWARRVDLTI